MKPNLLVAEGDAELRDIYRSYLARQGYEVTVAANGLDCLQQLKQSTPAVLVLEMELTWGGGDGVLSWLREEGARSEIPVIVITSAGCGPSALQEMAPPVVRFLAKPFALAALEESVRAAISNHGRAEAHWRPHAVCHSETFIG